jgi:hypothetical protein
MRLIPTATVSAQSTPTPRQAMTDYPVCTRAQRDNCRQPEGRRIPPPR